MSRNRLVTITSLTILSEYKFSFTFVFGDFYQVKRQVINIGFCLESLEISFFLCYDDSRYFSPPQITKTTHTHLYGQQFRNLQILNLALNCLLIESNHIKPSPDCGYQITIYKSIYLIMKKKLKMIIDDKTRYNSLCENKREYLER